MLPRTEYACLPTIACVVRAIGAIYHIGSHIGDHIEFKGHLKVKDTF